MALETAAAMSEAPVAGLPAGHLIDQDHAENRLVSRGQRRHAQGHNQIWARPQKDRISRLRDCAKYDLSRVTVDGRSRARRFYFAW
jgi:hypothetical protein